VAFILAWAADEQRVGWRGTDLAEKLPSGIDFQHMTAAPAPGRQASVASIRQSATGKGLEVVVRQYQPATPDTRQLTVTADNRVLARQSVVLRLGDNPLTVPCERLADVAGLRVSLDPDDLPADDSAWMVLTGGATNRVLLDAAGETDFLAHALRSTRKIPGAAFEPLTLPNGAWPANGAVVLRNGASFRDAALARLDQFWEAGGPVWIFVDGSAAQKDWLQRHGVRITTRTAATDPWHLRDWDADHPAMTAFAGRSLLPLLEVEFYQGFDLSGTDLAPIANWPDGKLAIAELDGGGHRLLLAGFPLDRAATDWPARASFVPFAHGAARWLGAVKDAPADWHVGDSIALPDGNGTWRALDSPVAQRDVVVVGSVRPAAPAPTTARKR